MIRRVASRHVAASGDDARRVDSQVGQELVALAVFDERIGYAEPPHVPRINAGVGARFQYGATEAAH
jgi:hypothetical protein